MIDDQRETRFAGTRARLETFAPRPGWRAGVFAGLGVTFFWTQVHFRVWRTERRMPLLLGWFLVALFIWFAENIATFSRAWVYPDQSATWTIVSPSKLGAWYLLMYISFILVATIHAPQPLAKDRS